VNINTWFNASDDDKIPKGRRRVETYAAPQTSLLSAPEPVDGDALGEAWEQFLSKGIETQILQARANGRPEPELLKTQPVYRKVKGAWTPCERGWLDYVLHLDGGRSVHFDAKACAKACAKTRHTHRWTLPLSLRIDHPKGHQVRRGQRLARLGHTALVALGVWEDGWIGAYLIPISAQGLPPAESHASLTWEELAPYRLEPATPKRVAEMIVGGGL